MNRLLLAIGLFLFATLSFAQDTLQTAKPKYYILVKQNGTEYVGEVLRQDAREVLIKTENLGEVIVPKHELAEMAPQRHEVVKQNGATFQGIILSQDAERILMRTDQIGEVVIPKHEMAEINALNQGSSRSRRHGATHRHMYLNSVSARGMESGQLDFSIGLSGAFVNYGLAKNISCTFLGLWNQSRIIGGAKYSKKIGAFDMAIGLGVNTEVGRSFGQSKAGLGLLLGVTYGNEKNNITFMLLPNSDPKEIDRPSKSTQLNSNFSVAGQYAVAKNVSLLVEFVGVTDYYMSSFIDDGYLMTGVRVTTKKGNAIQLGVGAIISRKIAKLDDPIPALRWMTTF